jgi:hypothetical protein
MSNQYDPNSLMNIVYNYLWSNILYPLQGTEASFENDTKDLFNVKHLKELSWKLVKEYFKETHTHWIDNDEDAVTLLEDWLDAMSKYRSSYLYKFVISPLAKLGFLESTEDIKMKIKESTSWYDYFSVSKNSKHQVGIIINEKTETFYALTLFQNAKEKSWVEKELTKLGSYYLYTPSYYFLFTKGDKEWLYISGGNMKEFLQSRHEALDFDWDDYTSIYLNNYLDDNPKIDIVVEEDVTLTSILKKYGIGIEWFE